MQSDGKTLRERIGTAGFVLLSVCAIAAFVMCWVLPIITYFAGNPFSACFEESELPTDVIAHSSSTMTWRLFPPTVECTWHLDEETTITEIAPLTPVNFPLLFGVQLAFIGVMSARRELRDPANQ